jgi:hypothetical protein
MTDTNATERMATENIISIRLKPAFGLHRGTDAPVNDFPQYSTDFVAPPIGYVSHAAYVKSA